MLASLTQRIKVGPLSRHLYSTSARRMSGYTLALHGGAGPLQIDRMSDAKRKECEVALNRACQAGEKAMELKQSALDVATATAMALEEEPLFNAGRGAVLDDSGRIEMEASLMDGQTLNAGACTAITQTRNPILLARRILEHSPHILLYGEGAESFARKQGLEQMEVSWFYTEKRVAHWRATAESGAPSLDHASGQQEKAQGTIGCVVRDPDGNLAAANSSGGMNRKWRGRVGDSCMIGPGTYADNRTAAIAGTGTGDYFIRGTTCYDVHSRMMYGKENLEDACQNSLNHLLEIGGEGGLIAIDKHGDIATPFVSGGMFRLVRKPDGTIETAIF